MNMVEVKINDEVKVGGNNPCFIIAEVGQNHQGDIEIAKKLIKAAKVSYFSIQIVLAGKHLFTLFTLKTKQRERTFCLMD